MFLRYYPNKMFLNFIILFALIAMKCAHSDYCPNEKKRFTTTPTICLPPNPSCDLKIRGEISDPAKEEILNVHNRLRSILASGKERAAGGMPPASNMMQMEWDDELAEIAQRWAENCDIREDCRLCRQVENFPVGQNIAVRFHFPGKKYNLTDYPAIWSEVVQSFYGAIQYFRNDRIDYFISDSSTDYLTQVIWANTWRVGCGYAVFTRRDELRHYYVCNYGPRGNIPKRSVYIAGKPCSGCPENACCGTSCSGTTFEGLCKMRDPNIAPGYLRDTKDEILYCGNEQWAEGCKVEYAGKDVWMTKKTLSGDIKQIRLSGGEESYMKLPRPFRPNGKFCVRLQYRKTPAIAKSGGSSTLKLLMEEIGGPRVVVDLKDSNNFIKAYSKDFKSTGIVKLSIGFVVEPRSPDHILDVQDLSVFRGPCSSKKTEHMLGHQR